MECEPVSIDELVANGIKIVVMDQMGVITPLSYLGRLQYDLRVNGHRLHEAQGCDARELVARLGTQYVGKAPETDEECAQLACAVADALDQDYRRPDEQALRARVNSASIRAGDLAGQILPYFPDFYRRLQQRYIGLAVFSSLPAELSRLILTHTPDGDLTSFMERFFDTSLGLKTEQRTYLAIAEMLGQLPEKLSYISDSQPEVTAA